MIIELGWELCRYLWLMISWIFNNIKEYLEVTDGNLASHLKALEKDEFIIVEKLFIGRKPNTRYQATNLGRKEFQKHINALELLIKNQK